MMGKKMPFSSRSSPEISFEISGRTICVLFPYRSFHQDRPQKFRYYVNPSIPKDKRFWMINLKTLHFEKYILSSRSPPEISFEISGRTWCYSSKIDLLITIASEKFRSKYLNIAPNCAQCGNFLYMLICFLPYERIFFIQKWTSVLTSPQARAALKCFEIALNNHSFFV